MVKLQSIFFYASTSIVRTLDYLHKMELEGLPVDTWRVVVMKDGEEIENVWARPSYTVPDFISAISKT